MKPIEATADLDTRAVGVAMDRPKDLEGRNLLEESLFESMPDPLAHMNDYNDQMSISQVVRFFEKQGIFLTKAMIQNYVRLGILPPPLSKRYYTRQHFMILAMLVKLKDSYSLDTFRDLFSSFAMPTKKGGIAVFYDFFLQMHQETLQHFRQTWLASWDKLQTLAEEAAIDTSEQNRILHALVLLTLLTQCAAAKQITDSFMEQSPKV